jgi:hypothetical protein
MQGGGFGDLGVVGPTMFKVAIINCHCVIVLWQRVLPSKTAKARNFDVIFREKKKLRVPYPLGKIWFIYVLEGGNERLWGM